jgi:polyferredoxin
VCPVGALSRALAWVGERTLLRRRRKEALLPRWLDAALTIPKYLLLAFFASTVFLRMDAASAQDFLQTPYNAAADAKMLLFFRDLSAAGVMVLASLGALSVVVKNAWCRFLCPYGALLGLFGAVSPQRVLRDDSTCIDCRRCTRSCPAEIRVHAKGSVLSPECIGCLDCVAACPVEDCMTVSRRARRGLSPYLVPALGVGAMFVAWIAARATGHWESSVPVGALRAVYRQAQSLTH